MSWLPRLLFIKITKTAIRFKNPNYSQIYVTTQKSPKIKVVQNSKFYNFTFNTIPKFGLHFEMQIWIQKWNIYGIMPFQITSNFIKQLWKLKNKLCTTQQALHFCFKSQPQNVLRFWNGFSRVKLNAGNSGFRKSIKTQMFWNWFIHTSQHISWNKVHTKHCNKDYKTFIKEEFDLFKRFPHQDSQSFLIIIINIISCNI